MCYILFLPLALIDRQRDVHQHRIETPKPHAPNSVCDQRTGENRLANKQKRRKFPMANRYDVTNLLCRVIRIFAVTGLWIYHIFCANSLCVHGQVCCIALM